ncbi:hypothetical protein Nham_4109 (plasmid) [Nitrobacter hamburgensis X14]|uniref:Uncharacterized protein n=1 Tax=Nitrobacter hamburgensis (strain DSM 10229 / NCIMB 13809 / X14) TaxID=323097 RepID=Q1QG93_NITHX|nr:hypothetical protein [Nitrobacter hamburgensis]ABE64754.1 hypothetical protein Nham_4109 [Nitrobacter hamburgensis X14]
MTRAEFKWTEWAYLPPSTRLAPNDVQALEALAAGKELHRPDRVHSPQNVFHRDEPYSAVSRDRPAACRFQEFDLRVWLRTAHQKT